MGKLLRNLLKSPMFVIGVSIFIITLLIALFGPLFYHVDINARDMAAGPYAGSSAEHLLGTDHLGRDYVSLLIEGLRSSLYVGLVAGVIATTIGVLIGLFGGFRGGWIDEVPSAPLSRTDVPSRLSALSSALPRGAGLPVPCVPRRLRCVAATTSRLPASTVLPRLRLS